MRPVAAFTLALSLLAAQHSLAASTPHTHEELDKGAVVEGVVMRVTTRMGIHYRPAPPLPAGDPGPPVRRDYTISVNVAASRGPSAPERHTVVEVHGWDMASGPAAAGVDGLKDLAEGTVARFYLERQGDGAPWTIREPNGLEHLGGS